MKQHTLTVVKREDVGRGAARRLRASGRIPAVVYGKSGPRALTVTEPDFRNLMREVAGSAAVVEIRGEGLEPTLSVVQDIQRDPVYDKFIHVDFHEVAAGDKLTTSIPVHTSGTAKGVSEQDGILDVILHEVEITCLPKDVPEALEVDISSLEVGSTLTVGDLPRFPGVEYTASPEDAVLSIVYQRVESAEEPSASDEAPREADEVEATAQKSETETAEEAKAEEEGKSG